MKVIHLPSGWDDHDHILGVPNYMSDDKAYELADTIIDKHQKAGEDWQVIEADLTSHGFYIVDIIDGPFWD